MKKTILTLVTCLFVLATSAQLTKVWHMRGNNKAELSYIKHINDTSFIAVFKTDFATISPFDPESGTTHIMLATTSDSIIWKVTLKGNHIIHGVLLTADAGFLAYGAFTDSVNIGNTMVKADSNDFTIPIAIKMNITGGIEWINRIDSTSECTTTAATETPTSYLVGGLSNDVNSFVATISKSGQTTRFQTYDRLRTLSDLYYHAADNSVYITGNCEPFTQFDTINVGNPPSAGYLSYIGRLDLNLRPFWLKTAPFVTFDLVNKLGTCGNNVFWFNATDTAANNTSLVYRLSKVNTAGDIQSVHLASNIIAPHHVSFNKNRALFYGKTYAIHRLFLFDSTLQSPYNLNFSEGFTSSGDMVSLFNDHYIFSGRYYNDTFHLGPKIHVSPYHPDTQNIFLAEVKMTIPVSVRDVDQTESVSIKIYPNPAHTSFGLSTDAHKAMLIDHLGRSITLQKKDDETFDCQNLARGMYYVWVIPKDGQMISAGKILLK